VTSPASEAQRELVLLERDAELATFATAVEAALGGDGTLVLVEGTAGIGKTRLLAEGRARAGEMRVLTARGGELEGEFAFGVVRQLFEPLLATAVPKARAELLAGAATLAEPIFEASSLVARTDVEGDASFAVLHGLYWLAANVAYDRPTLLAIDDLHWADGPSLRWLCYLARRLEGLPLLVACAMRPPEQGRDPALLTELLTDLRAPRSAPARWPSSRSLRSCGGASTTSPTPTSARRSRRRHEATRASSAAPLRCGSRAFRTRRRPSSRRPQFSATGPPCVTLRPSPGSTPRRPRARPSSFSTLIC
jgi:hypothetical protein